MSRPSAIDMLERIFQLRQNGTTARTEVVAGVTMFLTLAYFIFVRSRA